LNVQNGPRGIESPLRAEGLADILERVLDKGIVVAGDISISLVGVELLTIKLRLLVTTVDRAIELGINWWETDPMLSTKANSLEDENRRLKGRLAILERRVADTGA
jgi:Gas vesicle protein